MHEIEGIYCETIEDYYMILDELYRNMAEKEKADTGNIDWFSKYINWSISLTKGKINEIYKKGHEKWN